MMAITLFLLSLFAEVPTPTLDQIDLLVIKKQWPLAISKLQEVTPAEKSNPKWEKLVFSSIEGMVAEAIPQKKFADALQNTETFERTFPHLQRDSRFLELKDGIFIQGTEDCLKNSVPKNCLTASRFYIQKGLHHPKTTLNLAKTFVISNKCEEGLELVMSDITVGNSFCQENSLKNCYSKLMSSRSPAAQKKGLARISKRCGW